MYRLAISFFWFVSAQSAQPSPQEMSLAPLFFWKSHIYILGAMNGENCCEIGGYYVILQKV